MHVSKVIELNVHLAYDSEAKVWFVAMSDVPGLSLEADNPVRLIERISESAPRLIELNEDEILQNHAHEKRPSVAVKPVFDSPLQLAYT
jgi:hypothetical protein